MALVGYYLRFIEGISKLMYLISPLQKNGVKFVCLINVRRVLHKGNISLPFL
jgi:hypothetical protein